MSASDEGERLPLPNEPIITLSSAEARQLWSVYLSRGNPDPDDLDVDEARQILERLNAEAVAHIEALMRRDNERRQVRNEEQRQIVQQQRDEAQAKLAWAREGLEQIANRPMVDRDSDGVDQAAARMRRIAGRYFARLEREDE